MNERWRRYPLPVFGLVVLFALAAVVGYVTIDTGSNRPADDIPAVSFPGTRGVIQSVSGSTLTLSTGNASEQFTLADNAPVEALRPVNVAAIAAGDWLNVGGMSNSQSLFTIVGLTLIPEEMLDR